MQITLQPKARAVIWIDHEMALIVVSKDRVFHKNKKILSKLDQVLHDEVHHKHLSHKSAHRAEILKHFYKEIIFELGNIVEILIIGPAQAKHELGRQLEHHKGFKGKLFGKESAAKMTDLELIRFAEHYWAGSETEGIDLISQAHQS